MCEPHMVCELGHLQDRCGILKSSISRGDSPLADLPPRASKVMESSRKKTFSHVQPAFPGRSAAGVPDRVSPLAAHRSLAYPTSLPVPGGTAHAFGMLGHTRPVNKQHSIKHTSSTRRSLHRSIPQPLCTLRGRHIPASGRIRHIPTTAWSRFAHPDPHDLADPRKERLITHEHREVFPRAVGPKRYMLPGFPPLSSSVPTPEQTGGLLFGQLL